MLDLKKNYFDLFGLNPQFDINGADLQQHYRDIQAEVHPDRFAGKSDQEQRLAVQLATHINEAYDCLKEPLRRACYLLELKGHKIESDAKTHNDGDFLMQQMELREKLESIDQQGSVEAADAFMNEITLLEQGIQRQFVDAYQEGDYDSATDCVLRWQFLVKLRNDADKLVDNF